MNSRTKILINRKTTFSNLLLMILLLTVSGPAFASTTWYVNGVIGSDKNNCKLALTACKTIGHAISLARPSDSVSVAAATYRENLLIGFSLNVMGSGAATTIIDGGGANCPARFSITSCRVITISPTATTVVLSGLTIRNGSASYFSDGGSINNGDGGGISNSNATLTINNSTVSGNEANGGYCNVFNGAAFCYGGGGGSIYSSGTLTINNSTVSANKATTLCITGRYRVRCFPGPGGSIYSSGTLTLNNSTVSGNISPFGGGIVGESGTLTISSSTISGNSADGIAVGGTVKIQNSIVANNTGANCSAGGSGTITSLGYNLSSDDTCKFSNSGDRNNKNPLLAPLPLQYNGGPTQTQALLPGSPAIDAGNPLGCKDSQGHLLTTDQRGLPRPNKPETTGCDMGAYESQN